MEKDSIKIDTITIMNALRQRVTKCELALNETYHKWQEAQAALFSTREAMYAVESVIALEKRRLENQAKTIDTGVK